MISRNTTIAIIAVLVIALIYVNTYGIESLMSITSTKKQEITMDVGVSKIKIDEKPKDIVHVPRQIDSGIHTRLEVEKPVDLKSTIKGIANTITGVSSTADGFYPLQGDPEYMKMLSAR